MTPPTYPARPRKGGPLPIAVSAGVYKDESWRFEPKVNGWRALVHAPTGQMWNRHGAPLSIGNEFTEALTWLATLPFEWLDVEGLERRHSIGQGSLLVLDWITTFANHDQRRQILEQFIHPYLLGFEITLAAGNVHLVPSARYFSKGMMLWDTLPKHNADLGCIFYEGVVAKRGDSAYPIQLRSDEEEFAGWTKHRFTTAA